MKLTIFFLLPALLLQGSCSENEFPEKELVFVPLGAEGPNAEMITAIMEKPAPGQVDYIQLALLYAEYHEEPEAVRQVLEKALQLSPDTACYEIAGIVEAQCNWALVRNYQEVVEELLANHNCAEVAIE